MSTTEQERGLSCTQIIIQSGKHARTTNISFGHVPTILLSVPSVFLNNAYDSVCLQCFRRIFQSEINLVTSLVLYLNNLRECLTGNGNGLAVWCIVHIITDLIKDSLITVQR